MPLQILQMKDEGVSEVEVAREKRKKKVWPYAFDLGCSSNSGQWIL